MSQTQNRYLIIIILGALSTISPFAIDMWALAHLQIIFVEDLVSLQKTFVL